MNAKVAVDKLNQAAPQTVPENQAGGGWDEFLSSDELVPVHIEAAERMQESILAEMETLFRENRWEDALSLFYPIEEKAPEIVELGVDVSVREKNAFALGHLQRFDEAIVELQICVNRIPDDFYIHNSLAYTAYNSLYAAKNREIMLSGKARQQRIALAEKHFRAARTIRPDSVTNFYREGMLRKEFQRKPAAALPLFLKAVENWDNLSEKDRERRHQERKNFIKALYQGASAALETRRAQLSLRLVKRCLAEDEASGHVAREFKFFALGKIHYHLNQFEAARDALRFAARCDAERPVDFVHELLARCYLALDKPEKALERIARVPEKRRRPYVRWTESDVLCRMGNFEAAINVLKKSIERDNRSRHKSLLRLAKIEYRLGRFPQTTAWARRAGTFFERQWGRELPEALFWTALGEFKSGNNAGALETAHRLREIDPHHPKLGLLLERLQTVKKDGIRRVV